MALTIAIEGKGVIANCDVLTNDTGGTGTGDWSEQGGGTMTLSPDVFLYGSGSIGGKYANKDGFQQFDLGAGNELDFTATTGTETDQFVYMWVNMAAFAVLDELDDPSSGGGLFIRVSSDSPGTSNYLDYCIAGGKGEIASPSLVDANGWTGGWKLFVIDPNKAASRSNGTQSSILASVRTLGLYMETWDSVRAESIFIDQIAVASGLRITGTSTTGWKDVMEYCTDYVNRAWGMVQERDGIYYLFGKMYIGDSTQSAVTSFADSGRVLQFGISQYYESSAWKTSMPAGACGIVVEDHASYTTTFTDGVIVGSDNGRSGSTIIGNTDQTVSLDLYAGNNAGSVTAFYGTTLIDITGAINSGDDTGHKFLGVSFAGSSQFDTASSASGAPVLRNCVFAETSDSAGALLWNNYIDIQSSKFIANTTGPGIEHDTWNGTVSGTADNVTVDADTTILKDTGAFASGVSVNDYVYNETDESFGRVTAIDSDDQITHTALSGGTNDFWTNADAYSISTAYSYTDLTFSGNTNDVDNTTSPANVVAISKAGTSDPSSYPSGDFVVIQGSVTISIHVVDTANNNIETAQTAVYLSSDDSEILNADTNASGVASTTYAGTTPTSAYIRVRKSSTGDTKYIPNSTTGTIESGTGLSVTVVLREDPNA